MLFALAVLTAFSAPLRAQDMGDNGYTLPDFFFSRAEQIARSNCINDLPNCRADVESQLDMERAVSLVLPWFLLALGLVYLLRYMRQAEQRKDMQRRMAQRKHVPGSLRKVGKEEPEKERREDNGDEEDRFR
jgi:hypothetical protein